MVTAYRAFSSPHGTAELSLILHLSAMKELLAPQLHELEWWQFNRLFVQVGHRSKGEGTRLMGQVTSWADIWGHNILCHANPYEGEQDLERLLRFYEKFGFIRVCPHCGDELTKDPALLVRRPWR